MNGDDMADLVGFKGVGVWVALSTGRSFAPATLWSTNYSNDPGGGGWSSYDTYPRTLGDVDGSGRAAIVGFGNAGTFVAHYDHQARMYYDADGNRVVSINDGVRAVYIGDWVETGAAYYHLGGQRVAKRAAGGVTYLHGDHLGSVGKTTGAASSSQLYEAYGAKRGSSEVATPYRYTGQRWEENDALDIYYYKARWYDPALGRFLQPDTVVPSAANPQSLNRYSYVSNNPLRYTDPTGHAADSGGAGSDSHWVSDWHWKNRWYEAHGYFWKNGGWIRKGAPQFADEAITDEVIAEAGISLFPHPLNPVSWGWEDKQKVAYAVAMYGLKLRAGIAGLKSLLGGWATIFYGSGCCGSNCAPPIPFSYTNHEVDLVESFGGLGLVEGAQTVAHELAHVIDWQGRFSRRWYHHAGLTDYANGDPPQPYPRRWDNWAEAVTVWVFGDYDSNTDTFSTSYKPGEVSYYSNLPGVDLAADMNRMSELLNGWR